MSATAQRVRAGLALLALVGAAGTALFISRSRPAPVRKAPQIVEISRRQMIQRGGRWYQIGNTNAFSGVIVDATTNGAPISRVAVSNGFPNGGSEMWYANGQMSARECFKNGVSDGLREKWFENGHKMAQAMIVDGKVTGLFQRWHQNGELAESIQMRDGKPDGIAWAYYPSGFVKAETTLEDGRQLGRKSWKDGQFKRN
jgi:antitoxin component YwqK of YwqJK toxin-antitoxin module